MLETCLRSSFEPFKGQFRTSYPARVFNLRNQRTAEEAPWRAFVFYRDDKSLQGIQGNIGDPDGGLVN